MKSPSSEPFLGKRIREYEILALIGQGRMGAVYRARHVLLEQERAIKIVQTGMAGSSELADRFIREARILARMRHPNLVELYEFGKLEEGTFFMILELLRGESVRRRVDTLERIPALDAVRIAREAASGLHVAHSTGILHRDVSADNLFLVKNEAGEEVTKVIDFAIAKPTVQEARTMQSTQVQIGRPEFWSPEQFGIGGKDAPLDHRTDIYSLGVTLYYMITGKLPFISLVPKGTPEAITTYDVPPKLERVIRKALSIERENRQESMMELIQELDEVTYREVLPTIQAAPLPPAPARFQPGFVFAGRYEIQKKIGKGGMGTVFKALDRILDIPVALKTMNPEISTDEKTLARLKREVILARKVAHPNVCRLYDIGEFDGIHYVSMEFVDGMTLSDMLLLRGKLPPAEGLQILRQVLLALQEAHRARVIHRDLKPQNIMVDVHQRAFIMDFGISFSADVERLTTTGMMIGTPRYMAPEQFGETPGDLRADIYSMGIIFYEAFTGRLPFDAQTPASVMYAHLHTPPMPPTRLDPGIPVKLESIILKALEKDPDKRFQNVGEMMNAIDDSLAHPEIGACKPIASPPVPPEPPVSATPRPDSRVPPAHPQTESVPGLPPEPRSMVLPLIIAFVALIALGTTAYYYFISTQKAAPAASGPTAGAPQQIPARRETPPPVQAQPMPKQETKSEPLPSEPQSQVAALPRQQPTGTEIQPAQTGPTEPVATVPAVRPPMAAPATTGPGRISYQGEYPVSIFEGGKLILNTANAGSAELPPGTHKLTLVSTTKAIIRQNVSVEVKEGETLSIPAPAMSRFNLNATPSNCKIFIDMNFVDIAPIFDLPIQAGNHHVRAVWEKQGKEKSGFFTIAPDQPLTLRAIADETTLDIFEKRPPQERTASVNAGETDKTSSAPLPDLAQREAGAPGEPQKPKMADADARNRAIQLMQRGFEALNKKDFAGAEAAYREALAMAQQIGDSGIQANALNSLGFIFSRQGDDAKARETWQQALDLSVQSGDKAAQALALFNLSTAEYNLGNQEEANSLYEQSAARYKEIGQTPRPRPW